MFLPWWHLQNIVDVYPGDIFKRLSKDCWCFHPGDIFKIVDVFTLVTSSMELSCFSFLAITPSAWLTGEDDEVEFRVCFQKCQDWNRTKGGKIEGETIGEKKSYQQNWKTTKSIKGRPFSRDQVPTAIASKIWRISPRSIISVSCTSTSYNIGKTSVYYLEYVLFSNENHTRLLIWFSVVMAIRKGWWYWYTADSMATCLEGHSLQRCVLIRLSSPDRLSP